MTIPGTKGAIEWTKRQWTAGPKGKAIVILCIVVIFVIIVIGWRAYKAHSIRRK
jgi:predicted negative regulator of RcsB-dependent stress response